MRSVVVLPAIAKLPTKIGSSGTFGMRYPLEAMSCPSAFVFGPFLQAAGNIIPNKHIKEIMQIRLFFISIQRSFLCFIVTQSGHTFAHGAAFGPNGCPKGSPFQICRTLVSEMRAKICLLIKRHALPPVFLHRFCDFKKNISEKEADHNIRAGRTAHPARFIHRPITAAFAAMQGLFMQRHPARWHRRRSRGCGPRTYAQIPRRERRR